MNNRSRFLNLNKQFLLIISLLFLLLPFQNCNQRSSNDLSIDSSISDEIVKNQRAESGNGSGYEGKPDKEYFRFVPNFYCDKKLSPVEYFIVKDQKISHYSNKANECNHLEREYSIDEVNFSPFQKDFVVLDKHLYSRFDIQPLGIPEKLPEVLCRDHYKDPTKEIVVHFDRVQRKALARFYFKNTITDEIELNRLVSLTQIEYISSKLKFKIDFIDKSNPNGFNGTILSSTIEGVVPQKMDCVVGGSLDVSRWNIKQVTDQQTTLFYTNPKSGDLFFVSTISQYPNYISRMFHQSVSQSYELLKTGVDNLFTDLHTNLLGEDKITIGFLGLGPVVNETFLFHMNLIPSSGTSSSSFNSIHLFNSNTFSFISQNDFNFISTPLVDNDENYYIIRQENGLYLIDQFDSYFNKKVKIYENSIRPNYKLLKNKNKIIIAPKLFDEVKTNEFIIYDIQTRTHTKIKANLPDTCFLRTTFMEAIDNESKLLVYAECDSGNYTVYNWMKSINLFSIDLESGQSTRLFNGKFVVWISDDHNWFMVDDVYKPKPVYNYYYMFVDGSPKILVDAHSNEKFDVNYDACNTYFLYYQISMSPTSNLFDGLKCNYKIPYKSKKWIYGISGTKSSPYFLRFNTVSKTQQKICSNIEGQIRYYVNPEDSNKLFVLTYDTILKNYKIYEVDEESGHCHLANQFLSNIAIGDPQGIQSTEIGFTVSFNEYATLSSDLFFVPIDGRPAIKVNESLDKSYFIQVNSKLNRVYFLKPNSQQSSRLYMLDLAH